MNNTALIFGAGKTGRGFAAHLAFLGGYQIVLIDINRELVEGLKSQGQYDIQVLNNEEKNCTIPISAAYEVEDVSWHQEVVHTSVIFTAVFGNNLEALTNYLSEALQKRFKENPQEPLTIITCENLIDAAGFLKSKVATHLDHEQQKWLSERVGFSESIIFRTCLDAAPDQPPLTIRAQNFFELPCNADEMKGELHIPGLKPLTNFKNQLRRKIYTYNCINAVITYVGAQKGYTALHEAGNDETVLAIARKAARETCEAQIAEFGFDRAEQMEWMNAALAKFADKNVPDPIIRNGADPERKLGRDDRLIGPALLALKHKIVPEGLIAGIIACFKYRDPQKMDTIEDKIREKGADLILQQVCGLCPNEELFILLKGELLKSKLNGKG